MKFYIMEKKKLKKIIYLILFLNMFLFIPMYSISGTLESIDFDNQKTDQYTSGEVKQDWKQIQWTNRGVDAGRATIIDQGWGPSGKALKVRYPKGVIGSGGSGVSWLENLSPHDELYASYYVYFPSNFDAKKGGKLPGLCGKECPTGGESVTGLNGFSARFMFKEWPKAVLYLYHMHKPSEWGEDFTLKYKLERNKWIKLTQRIKMNTVGKRNGEIQVWVNDKEDIFLKNIEFRKNNNVKIDKFYFSTFFGGGTSDWQPVKDEYIYFDEFQIYTSDGDSNAVVSLVSPEHLRLLSTK